VVLVFGYYMVLSLGVYLAEHRYVPPTPALWIPNLVFAFMAVWLLRRAR
jgi:lipopolysaccharide export LptBFGC system permease protein LptF